MSLSDILPLEKAQCKSVKLLLCLLVLCIMSLEFKISGVLCNCLFCDLILPFCLPACPPVTSCWAPRAMFLWFCIASSHFCVFCTLVEWGGGRRQQKNNNQKRTNPPLQNQQKIHPCEVGVYIHYRMCGENVASGNHGVVCAGRELSESPSLVPVLQAETSLIRSGCRSHQTSVSQWGM